MDLNINLNITADDKLIAAIYKLSTFLTELMVNEGVGVAERLLQTAEKAKDKPKIEIVKEKVEPETKVKATESPNEEEILNEIRALFITKSRENKSDALKVLLAEHEAENITALKGKDTEELLKIKAKAGAL